MFSLRICFPKWRKWREGNEGRTVSPRSVNPGYRPEQKRLNQNYSRCTDIKLNTKPVIFRAASPLVPDPHWELCHWHFLPCDAL